LSVAKNLACRYCKAYELKVARGRKGVPIPFAKGQARLMLCKRCGKKNVLVSVVVYKWNSDAILEAFGV
jgi:hypothetical protein